MSQLRAAQVAEAEATGPSSYSSESEAGASALDEESLRKLREQFGNDELIQLRFESPAGSPGGAFACR